LPRPKLRTLEYCLSEAMQGDFADGGMPRNTHRVEAQIDAVRRHGEGKLRLQFACRVPAGDGSPLGE